MILLIKYLFTQLTVDGPYQPGHALYQLLVKT